MMAFAAAGSYKEGTDPYDDTLNPALNLTASIQNQSGGMISYAITIFLVRLVDTCHGADGRRHLVAGVAL